MTARKKKIHKIISSKTKAWPTPRPRADRFPGYIWSKVPVWERDRSRPRRRELSPQWSHITLANQDEKLTHMG